MRDKYKLRDEQFYSIYLVTCQYLLRKIIILILLKQNHLPA